MDEEWTICLAIAQHSGKNYQLWNHRRRLAMQMGRQNAKRELEFASSFLEVDQKNYHIWAHRQVCTGHHVFLLASCCSAIWYCHEQNVSTTLQS